MPAGDNKRILLIDLHQGFDDNEDVNGCPANYKGRDHHEDHASYAAHVSVLLLGAGQ